MNDISTLKYNLQFQCDTTKISSSFSLYSSNYALQVFYQNLDSNISNKIFLCFRVTHFSNPTTFFMIKKKQTRKTASIFQQRG